MQAAFLLCRADLEIRPQHNKFPHAMGVTGAAMSCRVHQVSLEGVIPLLCHFPSYQTLEAVPKGFRSGPLPRKVFGLQRSSEAVLLQRGFCCKCSAGTVVRTKVNFSSTTLKGKILLPGKQLVTPVPVVWYFEILCFRVQKGAAELYAQGLRCPCMELLDLG